jgi:hypothetical protein
MLRSPSVRDRASFHRGKKIFVSWLAALVLLTAIPASATPIVSVVPSTTNVNPGATFSVDFVISGVTDLFAVQLGILYDPAILTLIIANSTQGPLLPSAGPTIPFDPLVNVFEDAFSPGEILFYDALGSALPGATGSGVVLSLTFGAFAIGTSAISIGAFQGLPSELVSSGVDPQTGAPILIPFTVQNGSVTVSPVSVPEPGSLSMLALGSVLSIVVVRWRRRNTATLPVRL